MTDETKLSPRQAAEAKRAERKELAQVAYDAQRAIDLEAVIALEDEHGPSRVKVINVGHTVGLPTLVVVKCAKPSYLKRYRQSIKTTKGGAADMAAINDAAEALADQHIAYPDAETYAKLREERPGIHAQAGLEAIHLAEGVAADEGKD
jgi:hypothetical protein